MGKNVIRGFTIPIGGDTKELRKAFREIDSEVRDITTQTNALKKSLKTDWNMDSFVKAQTAATDAVNATEEKVKAVKKAIAEIGEADTDKTKEQIKLLNVELIKAETAAKNAKNSLDEIISSNFKNNLSKANTEIDLTKRKLDTLASGLSIHWDDNVFVQAQNTAREAVSKTSDKVIVLQNELKRLENEGKTEQTSQEFKNLSVEIDETKLKVKQAEKQLQDLNQVKFDRITDKIGKVGDTLMKTGGVLTAGVTLPLAYVGKKALDTASNLVEVQNVVDVAFKDSADSINKWSKSLLESNGISELTAKQNAGLYKSMANGMGVVDEVGTEMSKTLTELVGDVASFYNLEFEQVGNKLKSVFTGETESLKDIGVTMTEANLNAYALSHGMKELSDDMSQADKVALRYAFVVNSLKDAHGDFARTIDSEANQSKLAQEQFKALSAELAQELLPVATNIIKVTNDVMKSFSGMSESGKNATLVILGLAAGMGPVVTIAGTVTKGVQLVVKSVHALKKANDAAAVSQAALNASMNMNLLYFIAAALAAVTVGITAYTIANDEAVQKQKELTQAFKESTDEYNNYVDSIEQETQAKNAELDITDKLIDRYEQLNGKAGDNASKKAILQNTVNELSKLLGIEITLIDTEKFKFDATRESLEKLTDARRDEISQIAIRNKAIKAQETLLDLEDQEKTAKENLENAREKKEDYANSNFQNIIKTYKLDKNYYDAEQLFKKIQQQMQEAQAHVNAYTEYKPPVPKEIVTNKLSPEEIDRRMKSEKDILDARMSLGVYSEEQYYKKLQEIHSSYYGDKKKDVTQMTKEELQLNREIHNQEVALNKQKMADSKAYTSELTKNQKEYYDNQKKLAKDAYDNNKKLLKDNYESQKKLLKDSYDETKKSLEQEYKEDIQAIENAYKRKEKYINEQIKAIDKEIEARRRLKHEEEYSSQVDTIKAQLAYSKLDDFLRRELEAELKRLQDDEADYKWELEQTDRKAALQEELSNAKELADQQKAYLQETFEMKKEFLQEEYDTNIQMLDVTYNMQMEQLDNMFKMSADQMGKISNNFVDTITKGCQEAVKVLNNAVKKANSSIKEVQSGYNSFSYDNSNKSATFNLSQGTTEYQVQRMIERTFYND